MSIVSGPEFDLAGAAGTVADAGGFAPVPEVSTTDVAEAAATLALVRAFAMDQAQLSDEGGVDPTFGTVTWRTLVSGDRDPSSGLVAGVAQFGPGGTLNPHRHAPPEIYFGLSGDGIVTIDGVPHVIAPGVAVYLPGESEHGVVAGPQGLSFFYTFPVDRFDQVDYRFAAPALAAAAG